MDQVGHSFPIIQDLLVGPYGIFTMALTYALALILPIVGFFFLIFGFLEDSGYLPRLAVMSNRIFKIMGLNGKAVLPMILGLGCDTMATMTTRILESRKDKIIVTLLLALGIPCSAQLAVIFGMLAGFPAWIFIAWAVIIFGVILLVGFLAGKLIPGECASFILELPPLRWPQLKNILIKTLSRIEWYLQEAVPLFILGTLILFALDKSGAMSSLERWARPLVVNWLGLPVESTSSFIIGFLRRDYGAAGFFALAQKGLLTHNQILVALVTITLFVPCIANFFVIIKERGWKTALAIVGVVIFIALLMGGLVNWALKVWSLMKEELKYKCALCGHAFIMDGHSCPSSCPMSRHCNLVCCPNCGYSFPKGSRTVEFFKNLFKKRGKYELQP